MPIKSVPFLHFSTTGRFQATILSHLDFFRAPLRTPSRENWTAEGWSRRGRSQLAGKSELSQSLQLSAGSPAPEKATCTPAKPCTRPAADPDVGAITVYATGYWRVVVVFPQHSSSNKFHSSLKMIGVSLVLDCGTPPPIDELEWWPMWVNFPNEVLKSLEVCTEIFTSFFLEIMRTSIGETAWQWWPPSSLGMVYL